MLVPSFVKLVMDLDSIASCFAQVLLFETRLSISFSKFVLLISIFVFGVVGVVVTVDFVFIFVGDGHGCSQAGSRLQCRMGVCARVEDLLCGCLGMLFVEFVWFSLEVHAFHGVDSFCLCCMCSLFHCLSQRRVGGSYALRVSPAVTRLTVYRRPQVQTRKRFNPNLTDFNPNQKRFNPNLVTFGLTLFRFG